jgi:protein gp37
MIIGINLSNGTKKQRRNVMLDLRDDVHRVFSGSMCDVNDPAAPEDQRQRLNELIGKTTDLEWLLLSKYPKYYTRNFYPHPNMWVGTTVESDKQMGRARVIAEIDAAVKWLSCEPFLGRISDIPEGIDWVVVGGMSSPSKKSLVEMDIADVRYLRDLCLERGIAFFFKQWHTLTKDKNREDIDILDGKRWHQYPMPRTDHLKPMFG